jgi:hypothetical protein
MDALTRLFPLESSTNQERLVAMVEILHRRLAEAERKRSWGTLELCCSLKDGQAGTLTDRSTVTYKGSS